MSGRSPYNGWIREEARHIENRGEPLEHLLHVTRRTPLAAAGAVTLRPHMPPVQRQGYLNSCTAHALAAAVGYLHHGRQISRLELYYRSRAYEQQQHTDAGARLSNVLRVLMEHGVGHEREWPYPSDALKARAFVRPRVSAPSRRIFLGRHAHVQGGEQIRACLRAGLPVVLGIHESDALFSDEVARSGVLPRLDDGQAPPHTHAVCVIGYAETCARARTMLAAADPQRDEPHYEVRNSWGADWGDGGHFWVPASYLENPLLAGNALVVRT